jgi:hypothetical protein
MKLRPESLVVNGFYCTATKQFDEIFGRDSEYCGLRTPDIQKVVRNGCFWTCGRDASWIFFAPNCLGALAPSSHHDPPRGIDVNDKRLACCRLGGATDDCDGRSGGEL